MLGAVAAALGGIRGAKSQAKVSMRTELVRVDVSGPADAVALAQKAADDLRAAGRITGELTFTPSSDESVSELTVDADVAPTP
jgi:valyl-tRNA synthetase